MKNKGKSVRVSMRWKSMKKRMKNLKGKVNMLKSNFKELNMTSYKKMMKFHVFPLNLTLQRFKSLINFTNNSLINFTKKINKSPLSHSKSNP